MPDLAEIKQHIKTLANEFGFQQAGISNIDTTDFYPEFKQWVDDGYHGEMSYLARNQQLREKPSELHEGTCRVISLRFNYLPQNSTFSQVLEDTNSANISRYSLGRDYHKLMRKKLQKLAVAIAEYCNNDNEIKNQPLDYRVFVDSAPVLETSFAEKSGLGWKGKHTLVINKDAGSWFFLGEIFINLPLEVDSPVENLCGNCTSCINLCPTNAIIAPYKVDARKCISYLTIENKEAIPVEYRKAIGNRIYGCDDCQLACPWNRFSSLTKEDDFSPRHHLNNIALLGLFAWTEEEFNQKLQGNPIRRIGYESWTRNIAVALGNSNSSIIIINALESKKKQSSNMVNEHIDWALNELSSKEPQSSPINLKTLKLIRTVKKMMPRDA